MKVQSQNPGQYTHVTYSTQMHVGLKWAEEIDYGNLFQPWDLTNTNTMQLFYTVMFWYVSAIEHF